MKNSGADAGHIHKHRSSQSRSRTRGRAAEDETARNNERYSAGGRARRPATRSTSIVTSFVRDAKSGKILLLRRSYKVRSMRGMWSGVSGIIEGREKPLSRARIEIFEETGITKDKIRLIKSVVSAIRISSPQYKNHEWRVFPFLFEARSPEIRLNWENSDYKWVRTDEIGSYDTVPDLDKVLCGLL